MMAPLKNDCPVCGNGETHAFLAIPQVPIYCNVLWNSEDEALAAPKGDLDLAFCPDCGHVFNRAFDPGLMEYTGNYENSLHFSARFQEYAEALAADLMKRYDLRGKDIVEIACGKGDFLHMLCGGGKNRGVGFDPSYEPEREGEAGPDGFHVVQDYYSEKYLDQKADFICCRHALEHIQDGTEFMKSIRASIGERPDTVVFFEVPNVLWSLKDLGIWDFIYEHTSYFSDASLARCFQEAGFTVERCYEAFGGQYLGIEARPMETVAVASNSKRVAEIQGYVKAIPGDFEKKRSSWIKKLSLLEKSGRKAAVWGGGSKGATFLNLMAAKTSVVPCVVDINPHKQGKFVPGMGQKVISPQELSGYDVDLIIVMNPLYLEEIRRGVETLGITAEILAEGQIQESIS